MALPYVGFTLVLIPLFRATWIGSLYLLYLMLLVWCGDIAAYYVGRAIGKHKLAPRISPGKTWEGAVASVVGAVIVGLLLFHYINPIASGLRSAHLLTGRTYWFGSPIPATQPLILAPVWFVALFAICVNVAAQLGDLVESALKRGAGVKDSGTLLPGHGGVLDRIDALLFALPVGLIFYLAGMSRYFSYPPYGLSRRKYRLRRVSCDLLVAYGSEARSCRAYGTGSSDLYPAFRLRLHAGLRLCRPSGSDFALGRNFELRATRR